MKTGTLKELNVKLGDVVTCGFDSKFTVIREGCLKSHWSGNEIDYSYNWDKANNFTLISRASDEPKMFGDMTPDEKGALLLAHHEGKAIEVWNGEYWECVEPIFAEFVAYRVKPSPKVEVATVYGAPDKHVQWCLEQCDLDTHRITFTTIDGVPDCSSIKMEAL